MKIIAWFCRHFSRKNKKTLTQQFKDLRKRDYVEKKSI